ncbi:MAG: hypothetical protein R6U11_01405 [Bacteroidales bacterium]
MQANSTQAGNNKKTSLSEVLNIFSDIDIKIMELHKCSSSDFLALNAALKDNHKKANIITGITKEAFQKLGTDGNIIVFQQLKNDLSNLKKQANKFIIKVDKSLSCLENVQLYLNMIPVSVNSYIQNLSVLKLLFSNIKLTSSFSGFSTSNLTKEDNSLIEKELISIKKLCQPIEKNISSTQNSIKPLYDTLSAVKKDVLFKIINQIDKAQNEVEFLEKQNKNAFKLQKQFDVMSDNFSKNVESIITNLQYHDIIRQKMEHIQQTHQLVKNDINEIEKTKSNISGKAKIYACIMQIPQISKIQTAQLLHANKEFQQAIDRITKKMSEIGQNINQTARIFKSLPVFGEQNGKINIDKSNEIFKDVLFTCKLGTGEFSAINKNTLQIQNSINELQKLFSEIDSLDNAIEQMVVKKFTNGLLLNNKKNTENYTQAEQILKIYSDNHYEKSKINKLLINITEQINNSLRINKSFISKKHGILNLEKTSHSAIDKISNIKAVYSSLKDAKKLIIINSNEISEQNKKAVKESKYYKYFERTIDEIVNSFNNISKIVKTNNLTDIEGIKNDKNFKQIEDYYTMHSERMIHNQALAAEEANQDNNNDNDSDEGNDVEFF